MLIAVFFLPFLSTAIEIGFTRERITRLEHFATQFEEIINKSRVSEQAFQLQIEISTIVTGSGLQRATHGEDFAIGSPNTTLVYNTLAPGESNLLFGYIISNDDRPENTEVFQVSVTPDPRNASNPSFDCNRENGCYRRLEVRIEDDDGESSKKVIKIAINTVTAQLPKTVLMLQLLWSGLWRHLLMLMKLMGKLLSILLSVPH